MKSIRRPLGTLAALFFLASVSSHGASLITVEENGPRNARINIVFLSEGYTVTDMPAFATHVNNAIAYLFSREPWKQYRAYFNIYRIEVASNQSGTDNGSAGGLRDTYFNSGFNTPTVPQLLTVPGAGQSLAYSLLNSLVPEYDIPVFLVNDGKYGGAGGAISVASVHSSSAMIVEHEVGHSFAGLADEYDTYYAIYNPVESYNVTQQTNRHLVRWGAWIDASTPLPTPETFTYDLVVGVFEGAMYRTEGWYRPHNNSVMRNLGRPVGPVNREKFVLSYYERINPIQGRSPATLSQTVTNLGMLAFSVDPINPGGSPALSVQWRVDGAAISSATNQTFNIASDQLGNGFHSVSVVVRDNTSFVRNDPSGWLEESLQWNINLSNQLPPTLAAWRETYGPDDANPSGDGLNNIAKYALGLDPTRPAGAGERPFASLTELSPTARYLTLNVPRKIRRTDINYLVRSSPDLSTWAAGPGHTETLEDSATWLKVRDAQPLTTNGFLDFRVQEK